MGYQKKRGSKDKGKILPGVSGLGVVQFAEKRNAQGETG